MTSPPIVQSSSSGVPAKVAVLPLLIAVVLGIVIATLGVGGIVYYLARSGRLPMQSGAAARVESVAPLATHSMVLEPLLVNLADRGGSAYLRLGLTLQVADSVDKSSAKGNDGKDAAGKNGKDAELAAAVRDTALLVLGRQSSEGLLAEDGKERLKGELKEAISEHNSDLKVKDLYFTEFLVQR